jgi:hypothetical protein
MPEPMIVPPTGVGRSINQVDAFDRHLTVGLFNVAGPPYALGRAYG